MQLSKYSTAPKYKILLLEKDSKINLLKVLHQI